MSECALLSIGDMSDLSAGPEQEGVADFDLVAVAGGEAELPVAPLKEGAEVDGIPELNTTASPVVCEGLGRAACMGCPLFQQCLERQQMTEGVADDGQEPKSYLEELLSKDGPELVMARPPAPEVTAPSPTPTARERVPAVPPVEPRPPMVKSRPAGGEVANSREVTVESSCASEDLPLIADGMPGVITPADALSPPLALQPAPQANDTSASLQAPTRQVDMVQQRVWPQGENDKLSDLPVAVTEPHDGASGVVPQGAIWPNRGDTTSSTVSVGNHPSLADRIQQTTVSQKPPIKENTLPNDVERTTAMGEVGDDDQNAITVPAVAEVSRVVAGAYQFRNDASPKARAAGNEVGADNYEAVNTTDGVFSCEIARTLDCASDTETVIHVDAPASEANAAPLEIQPTLGELYGAAEYEGEQVVMHYAAADKHALPQPTAPAAVLLQEWRVAVQQIAGVGEVGDVAVPDSTVDTEVSLPTGVPCNEPAEAVTLQHDVNNTTLMPHYSNNNNTAPEDNPEYTAGWVRGMTTGSVVGSIVLGVVAVWVTVARGLVRQPSTV